MTRRRPDWQLYERLIASLLVKELPTDLCVTVNAKVRGLISGTTRQVDVLIDARHDSVNSRRIVVDAKKRQRKLDVVHVEAFESFMKDVGATHGFLVSPAGHSKAAERRAQQTITVRIVPLEHITTIDPTAWPPCQVPGCQHGRVFWDGYPELYLMVRKATDASSAPLKKIAFVHYVGKCDRCGRFHVKCLTCEELFSLNDDEGDHRCRCRAPWFWLASIEMDENDVPSAELHVVLATGELRTVDRRPVSRGQI